MKNKEAFKNWYCEFLGLNPKITKEGDLTYVDRDTETWEACESYYENRKCEDCKHYLPATTITTEAGENYPTDSGCTYFLGTENRSVGEPEKDFCCKYWEGL